MTWWERNWLRVLENDLSSFTHASFPTTPGAVGGNWTGTIVAYAKEIYFGDITIGGVRIGGTTSSTPAYLTFTPPRNASFTSPAVAIINNAGGSAVVANCFYQGGVFRVYGDHLTGGWGNGTSTIFVIFVYEG